MYPQVIAEASNKIDLKFPASTDAKISPDKPRTSDMHAAMKVPVRLPQNKRMQNQPIVLSYKKKPFNVVIIRC